MDVRNKTRETRQNSVETIISQPGNKIYIESFPSIPNTLGLPLLEILVLLSHPPMYRLLSPNSRKLLFHRSRFGRFLTSSPVQMAENDLYYEPSKGQESGLPHDPFKSCVIPRPIGWISTTSKDGQDNLGPFSQFNNVSFDPPTILFIAQQSEHKMGSKDSVVNATDTGEFVWNMAT